MKINKELLTHPDDLKVTLGADPEFVFWEKEAGRWTSEVDAKEVFCRNCSQRAYRRTCENCDMSPCDYCEDEGDHPCSHGGDCTEDRDDYDYICERCEDREDCQYLADGDVCEAFTNTMCEDCTASVCDNCSRSACDYCEGEETTCYDCPLMDATVGTDGCDSTGELRPDPSHDAEEVTNCLLGLIEKAKSIASNENCTISFEGDQSVLGCHIHLGNSNLKENDIRERLGAYIEDRFLPLAKRLNPPARRNSHYGVRGLTKFQPHGMEWRGFPATLLEDMELFKLVSKSMQKIAERYLRGDELPDDHYRIPYDREIRRRVKALQERLEFDN